MIVLLSPAKRLRVPEEKSNGSKGSEPLFLESSQRIMKTLSTKSPRSLAKLQSVNREIAEMNFERNQLWSERKGEGLYHSLELFDGEVYRGLDFNNWNETTLSYAQDHLLILSGLYGFLRPKDMILPYRLEMGTKLKIGRRSNLYEFWGDNLLQELRNIAQDQMIINLASSEYSKAIKPKQLTDQIHEVDFLEDKGDGKEPKAIQVFLKQARGMLAKYILENQVLNIDGVRSFVDGGYFFDESRSTNHKTVFLRLH